MTWLRMTSLALGAALAAACQSNTIDLESSTHAGDGDDDDGDDTTGSPTTGLPTVEPDPTVDPDGGDVDTADPDPSDTVDPDPSDTGDMPPPPVQPFLLAIDTIIAPGQPVQGIVWLTPSGGGSTVDITLQWLATETRTPVGDVYAYAGVPVDELGGFLWETGIILLPGEANPITGADIVLSAVLQAEVAAEPFCGPVGGQTLEPIEIPLDGSTHAMTAVPSVEELPDPFLSACP